MPNERSNNQPALFTEAPWPPFRNAILGVLRQHRPHTVSGFGEVDVTDTLAALRRHQRAAGIAVSFHAFILYCVARAAETNPAVNTYRFGNKLITFKDVDVSTALEKRVPGQGRLPVGYVLRSANRKSLAEINWEIRQASRSDLATDPNVQARRRLARMPGVLRRAVFWWVNRDPGRMKNFRGTIGLTNIQRPDFHTPFFAIAPNVFTLTMAVGSITPRVMLDAKGQPEIRQMLCITGGADHALIDGMNLARFAQRLAELIRSAAGLDDAFVEQCRQLRSKSRE